MALKVKDGFVIIKTKKDAQEALESFQQLKGEIDELREESGLNDLEKDAMALKVAVENFMIDNKLEQIQATGFHGTLVKGFHDSHWIGTDNDLKDGDPAGAKSFQAIIEKKFKSSIDEKGSKARKMWLKITRRVIDHAAVEELVQAGKLKVDEIAPAWSEKPKKPYLRVFED